MRTALMLFALTPVMALAHTGHGGGDVHTHASDTWGWSLALVIAALGLWLSRRR
jgi:hypothetical protein